MNAVIFLNGEYKYEKDIFQKFINDKVDIFCADGGANYCLEYGYVPKCIYGDLDSIKPEILKKVKNMGVELKKFPPEKDYSDFELVLEEIDYEKYEKIYVVGALGNRTDFTFNNVLLMEKYKKLYILTKNEIIFFREKNFVIKNKKNMNLSIISLDKEIKNLTLEGVKYPLLNRNIQRSSSILMSNIILSDNANINFESGKLVIILYSD